MVGAGTLISMTREEHPCPLDPDKVIERYFLEHRAKLIDLAAFLDRIDRAGGDRDDFRIRTMMRGIRELATEESCALCRADGRCVGRFRVDSAREVAALVRALGRGAPPLGTSRAMLVFREVADAAAAG